MAIDMAALKVSGVAGTTLLIPLPLVIHKKGATPPMRYSRIYRRTWKHNGAAHYVVVKVVSRRQVAHEARVLKAVSARP